MVTLAIDIGGTAVKYGLIDDKGLIVERYETPTEAHLGGPHILELVCSLVVSFKEKAELKGVAISSAGMVDPVKGEIFYAGPQIPNYAGTQFKKVIEERFNLPCEIENDVNCAGLAESISGAGKGSSLSLCLTIGTGIGGCLIQGGQIFHGSSYSACEVGYIPLPNGAFQDIASTTALVKTVAEATGDDVSDWNGRRVFTEARSGNDICRSAISQLVKNLALGIASICYVVNPEIVILGGGIMAQEDYLRPELEAMLKEVLVPSIAEKTQLAFAQHQNDAGMLGAYYHFISKLGEK
ncbi:ROK family protein [Streptococcus sp. S784/96/1]|uniref:ROK family protein n=1 Tax=Streptococcus sp. S784/96/1 TaxID=2653499 RepID=UPI00138A6C1D|nr:ROK family protein [Streptococcus sp. S784/96/1]